MSRCPSGSRRSRLRSRNASTAATATGTTPTAQPRPPAVERVRARRRRTSRSPAPPRDRDRGCAARAVAEDDRIGDERRVQRGRHHQERAPASRRGSCCHCVERHPRRHDGADRDEAPTRPAPSSARMATICATWITSSAANGGRAPLAAAVSTAPSLAKSTTAPHARPTSRQAARRRRRRPLDPDPRQRVRAHRRRRKHDRQAPHRRAGCAGPGNDHQRRGDGAGGVQRGRAREQRRGTRAERHHRQRRRRSATAGATTRGWRRSR